VAGRRRRAEAFNCWTLAGVWAHHAEEKWRFIEPGDVEAAMQTASAIGDDRLQRRTQGYVVPLSPMARRNSARAGS
jgi:predicted metalloprotease